MLVIFTAINSSFAQHTTRFPNGQVNPLAGVGIAIDEEGRKITYDLETEEILSIEPPINNPAIIRAPAQVERAPLGQPAPQAKSLNGTNNPDKTNKETLTAAVVKPENPNFQDEQVIAKRQILLDRLAISPGIIDARSGNNLDKAIDIYHQVTGRDLANTAISELEKELIRTGGPAFVNYTISRNDLAGPFVEAIPANYAQKAKLPAMSFTSPLEKLAERFHMDENYLRRLNPEVNFSHIGTIIKVANTGIKKSGIVSRIEADKGNKQVRAYDALGELLAAYPATIGSAETPSPSGTVTVERIAIEPNYTYNPKINFKQGNNNKVLTIPPGPNGPVGSVWIALSKPTYGIHGTPEPAKIGKTNSHGCIRLTNWDATELAGMTSKDVTVTFVE